MYSEEILKVVIHVEASSRRYTRARGYQRPSEVD